MNIGAADGLRLAAAPAFAIMAVLTVLFGGEQMPMICSADTSLLTGMVPMYALMSVFHAPPWLQLIAKRRKIRFSNPATAFLEMPGNTART
ncbi:MAG TPA: hypothetical protein VNN98_04635 [Rhizomicrobium sp.]|nr:hypothetical protein [Rhizomicrobium sp.]